ncbi:MAG TPA: hypothetical protein VGM91_04000 [Conexibacter sp.]
MSSADRDAEQPGGDSGERRPAPRDQPSSTTAKEAALARALERAVERLRAAPLDDLQPTLPRAER